MRHCSALPPTATDVNVSDNSHNGEPRGEFYGEQPARIYWLPCQHLLPADLALMRPLSDDLASKNNNGYMWKIAAPTQLQTAFNQQASVSVKCNHAYDKANLSAIQTANFNVGSGRDSMMHPPTLFRASTSTLSSIVMATPFANSELQLSAVATLFGASNATSFALGNKGAAGLPWASISTFGAVHVAKASLSAAIPDCIREPLGLAGEEIEAAVGKLEEVKENGNCTVRDYEIEVSAIQMLIFSPFLWRKATDKRIKGDILPFARKTGDGNGATRRAIYSLDATCRAFERAIIKSDHKTLRIHHIQPKAIGSSVESLTPTKDWIILLASLLKLVEIGVLWHLGAEGLWWSSSVAWLASFCGAFALKVFRLSRDDFTVARSNLLIGPMPTPLKPSGEGHVLLGTSGNVRHHWSWRAVWIFNTTAVLLSLFATFFALPNVSPATVYIWLGFQSFFMLTRILVHHLAVSISSNAFLLRSESWDESSALAKRQSLELLMGLAQYNNTIHPRGARPYRLSLTCFEGISLRLSSCSWRITETLYLPQSTASSLGVQEMITFIDVIPDTVISTIAWTLDKQFIGLYDSAVVFIRNMAIPCVRAYTCACKEYPIDGSIRGVAHDCSARKWIFWIPYCTRQGEEGYLSVWTEETHEVTNECERIDHQTLHARLSKKVGINVSIIHGDEITMILERTREVAKKMVEMFKEAQGVRY